MDYRNTKITQHALKVSSVFEMLKLASVGKKKITKDLTLTPFHVLTSSILQVNALTGLSVVSDDLFDLCYDVLNVGGDVADGGVQSLVHLGGQVLDVSDELLHLAEDVDQLEGRTQLGVACRRTQRSQQVESRPLCGRY